MKEHLLRLRVTNGSNYSHVYQLKCLVTDIVRDPVAHRLVHVGNQVRGNKRGPELTM